MPLGIFLCFLSFLVIELKFKFLLLEIIVFHKLCHKAQIKWVIDTLVVLSKGDNL